MQRLLLKFSKIYSNLWVGRKNLEEEKVGERKREKSKNNSKILLKTLLKSNLRVYWKKSGSAAWCERCLNINNRDHEKGIYWRWWWCGCGVEEEEKTIDEGGKWWKIVYVILSHH